MGSPAGEPRPGSVGRGHGVAGSEAGGVAAAAFWVATLRLGSLPSIQIPRSSQNRVHGLVRIGFGLGALDSDPQRDVWPQAERGSAVPSAPAGSRRL